MVLQHNTGQVKEAGELNAKTDHNALHQVFSRLNLTALKIIVLRSYTE